jgi:hypothetical protein
MPASRAVCVLFALPVVQCGLGCSDLGIRAGFIVGACPRPAELCSLLVADQQRMCAALR